MAPLVFPLYFELHVAIVACLVVAALSMVAESPQRFAASRWWWLAWFETTLAIAALLFVAARGATSISRLAARNFYGALRVVEIDDVSETLRRRHLVHGLTDHGFQFTSPPRRRQPTSYYSPRSGIGIVLSAFRNDVPRRVAVLGLGVGTIAAYGRPGDEFRFFEINPLVVSLAKNEFSFLADSAARIDIRVGDARLALERDDTPRYDILVADAFTSDAIPVHLLTEEAFRVYFARLAPGGVLAIHISNRVLDLRPVVAAAADALGAHIVFVNSDAVPAEGSFQAHWALLSREERSLASLPIPDAGARVAPPPERRVLWRDDYSNLLGILK
jgi:SAM-dependent methyltransferase